MVDVKVVLGSNFGDEGKGLMSDFFSHQATSSGKQCAVVLANGGAQRGHTVTTPDGFHHVFHHFGAGTFAGAASYCISDFILNPMTFVKEYLELAQLGYKPKMFIESACRWSTPFDMIINQILEEARGENKHGSCGMGIWETVVRYQRTGDKNIPFSEFTLMPVEKQREYLRDIRDNYFFARLAEEGIFVLPEEWQDIVYSSNLIDHFINDMKFMEEHTSPAFTFPLNNFDSIVFENGQGLLLDQNMAFYGNNTTPSATGSVNAITSLNKYFKDYTDGVNIELCYVTRTYMTRHGVGRFETECRKSSINPDMFDETNVTNKFQDHLRYGELILPNLVDRVSADFRGAFHNLSLTKHVNLTANIAVTHTNEHKIDYSRLKDQVVSNIYISDDRTRDSVKVFNEF